MVELVELPASCLTCRDYDTVEHAVRNVSLGIVSA